MMGEDKGGDIEMEEIQYNNNTKKKEKAVKIGKTVKDEESIA